MASDSRLTLNTTQQQQGQPMVHLAVSQSDTIYRTFLAPNNIGISIYGAVDIQGVPIASYIEAFIREQLGSGQKEVEEVPYPLSTGTNGTNRTQRQQKEVDEIPHLLVNYFQRLPVQPDTGFHVAGYKTVQNQRLQQVWQVSVRTGETKMVNENQNQGVTWSGEADILARLLQPVAIKDASGTWQPLPSYAIPWQFFTLQDGVDFAVYALRTTIDLMRFQPRAKTVGGPIDVLVIKPDTAFWVQRKELRISG